MARGKYKRYYIPIGAFLITLFAFLQLWGLEIVDQSGNFTCEEECVSYFYVRNPTAKSIYIYNYQDVHLDFSPEIKDYQLYVKYYGKWRPMDFTNATRLGNVPKRAKYSFVFPRYSVKYFKLVGHKEVTETIKWGFGFENDYLDPVWIGVSNVFDCKNKTTTESKEIRVYKNTTIYKVVAYNASCKNIINLPNGTFCNISLIRSVFDYTKTIYTNKTECIKQGWIKSPSLNLSYENGYCRLSGKVIHCVAHTDGGEHVDCVKEKHCEIWNVTSMNRLESYGEANQKFIKKVIGLEVS